MQNFKPISINAVTLLIVAGIAVVAFLSILYQVTVYQSEWAAYNPTNGSWQNFNALSRVYNGERPGVDFTLYLGFGPMLLAYPIFALAGGSYTDSTAVLYAIHHVTFVFAAYGLARLSGLRGAISVITSVLLYILVGLKMPVPYLAPINNLLSPNSSVLGLRSLLPFVTLGALYVAHRLAPTALTGMRGAALAGAIAGLQPLWSNDYGIPSALVLVALAVAVLPDWTRPKSLLQVSAVLLVSAGGAFIVGATVLTQGSPLQWAQENFVSIATDQFWYFVLNPEQKVFSLSDVPFNWLFLVGITAIGVLIAAYLKDKTKLQYLALVYIASTSLLAGYLGFVGGMALDRYFAGWWRAAIYIIPVAAMVAWRWRKLRLGISFPVGVRRCCSAIGTVATVFVLMFGAAQSEIIVHERNFPDDRRAADVPELDGRLPGNIMPLVEEARLVRRELDALGIEGDRRVFSTYATAFDRIAGASPATRQDYIIHALGSANRDAYVEALVTGRFPYATTPSADLIKWETWNERVNWWFYREFYLRYEPLKVIAYARLWRLRPEPLSPVGRRLTCTVYQDSASNVRIELPGETGGRGKVYVEIAIDYGVDLVELPLPLIGDRAIVQAAVDGSGRRRSHPIFEVASFGISAGQQRALFPVLHDRGRTSTIALRAYPGDRASLTLRSCTAIEYLDAQQVEFHRASGSNSIRGRIHVSEVTKRASVIDYERDGIIGIPIQDAPLEDIRAGLIAESRCLEDPRVVGVLYPPLVLGFKGEHDDALRECLAQEGELVLRSGSEQDQGIGEVFREGEYDE